MILDENEADVVQIMGGGEWNRERWWHRLIQVCRRWRYLVLESAFHLQVSLVCARGTPVADMMAHSPPVPLIIDHFDERQDLTAEDEEGIRFALQHRARVRRIRLMKPVSTLEKLVKALDGEFPVLEFLFIQHQRYHRPVIEYETNLELPETFRAPNLRQLVLKNFSTPIESPSFKTMGHLVSLTIGKIPSSAYFHPDALLQWLSLLPQLETLWIGFNFSRVVEDQLLLLTPSTTRVTLPNLHWFGFRGSSIYLEALLPCVTMPLLDKLHIYLFNRMIYSIPHLQQLTSSARNLRLKAATFTFHSDCLDVKAYSYKGDRLCTLSMELGCRHLDWQVVSAAQVFRALRNILSAVEHLDIEYRRPFISLEWNDEADRARWREFFGTFGKVKTLFVDGELVGQLSRALRPGEEESSTELLPELRALSSSAKASLLDAFRPFVDARQKAGRPVTII